MKRALSAILIAVVFLLFSCNLDLEKVPNEQGSVNSNIFPYLKFELSDDLTYYIATVVEGAALEHISIPGEIHTEFGSMPIEEFGGFDNPEDAKLLRYLYLDANVEHVNEDALKHAENLEHIEHMGVDGNSKWARLPEMEKDGFHFAGWIAGEDWIWAYVDGRYVQLKESMDPANNEAVPVFIPLKHVGRVEATCTQAGNLEYYYCEECGRKYSDSDGCYELEDVEIAPLGHSLVLMGRIEPTCENNGQVEHYHCEICELNYEDSEGRTLIDDIALDKVDHESDGEFRSNDDSHWYECVWCGEMLEKAEHEWDNGEVKEYPTEDKDGLKIYTCGICGKEKEEILSSHEHEVGEDAEVIPATCTEGSYKKGLCIVCGREVTIKTGEKLDHDLSEVKRVEPDCESEGTRRHFNCSRCGLNFANEGASLAIEDITIPALGHSYKTTWSSDSTHHWHECSRDKSHRTEAIEHSFTEKNASERFIKAPANCDHGDIYYKSCVCGETNKLDTFEVGEPVHEFDNEDGNPNYAYNADEHWIECVICNVKKDGTSDGHSLEKEGANKICTVCPYLIPGVSGSFNPEREEKDPRGELIQVSQEGSVFTFKVVDKNGAFPITSYRWETSGTATSEANKSTFSFEAPRKKSYSVRCIFSNGYGTSSLSATVSGGNGN